MLDEDIKIVVFVKFLLTFEWYFANLPMISMISRSIFLPKSSNFFKIAHSTPNHSFFTTQLRMSHNVVNKVENKNQERIRSLVNSDPTGGWEKCWEEGLTPWDLGQPTPVLLHLHSTGALPKGRALIPGCGSGHDVMTIACPERHVVGLDISEKAIQRAKQLSCSFPNADNLTFLKEDFFSWRPTELFNLIFDYTFFCAIEPDMRSLWASRIHELLKPDGELITLIFPISNHEGGPPYAVSVNNYEEVLHPIGIKAISIVDNEMAVAPRRGREKLARWKRVKTESLL